jgi:hypothetical protein
MTTPNEGEGWPRSHPNRSRVVCGHHNQIGMAAKPFQLDRSWLSDRFNQKRVTGRPPLSSTMSGRTPTLFSFFFFSLYFISKKSTSKPICVFSK